MFANVKIIKLKNKNHRISKQTFVGGMNSHFFNGFIIYFNKFDVIIIFNIKISAYLSLFFFLDNLILTLFHLF